MKIKLYNRLNLMSLVTIFMVTFFIVQFAYAQNNVLIDYFVKTYAGEDLKSSDQDKISKNIFGTINWLPGEEFEIFIVKTALAQVHVPTDNTPDFIKENIEKKIKKLQKPTREELAQTVDAEIVDHNLPIAVLNVWRPHTVIKIKNNTNYSWTKNNTILKSQDIDGQISFFRDPTWITDKIVTAMNEPRVNPGETATFEFLIDGRGQALVYYHVYQLEVAGKILHLGAKGSLHWLTRVDAYSD